MALGESTCGDTQRCRRCGYVLHISYFGLKYPDRPYRVRICYLCVREQSRQYYLLDPAVYKARAKVGRKRARQANRAKLHAYLAEHPCVDCGLSDLAALEFDHRDRVEKLDDVGTLVGQPISWARIAREIAKCDVVCANCHRRRTAKQFGWRRLLGLEELVLPRLPPRGTPEYERIKSMRSRLARQHRNRRCVYEYLRSHPCVLCGVIDPVLLEFDRVRDKLRDVTRIAAIGGHADLLAEIDKCRVLCANCHRRQTAHQDGRDR